MKAPDWFGVGVRLFGVYCLFEAVGYFAVICELRLGLHKDYTTEALGTGHRLTLSYLWHGFTQLALSAFLLFGANHLIGWTYPAAQADSSSSTTTPSRADESESGKSKTTLADPTSDGE